LRAASGCKRATRWFRALRRPRTGRNRGADWTRALPPAKKPKRVLVTGQKLMKLIHAADLHLDSPLRGLSARSRPTLERVRTATRRAFANLVELCLSERAGLLLIAGDVYDGDWRDYSTGLYFAHEMARLRDAGVQVVMIRGNHDAASQITKNLRLPDNVHELSAKRAQTLALDALGVAVHGQSFANRAVTENLAQSYPERVPGLVNIGLLHTSVTGRSGHEPYAPCSVADLLNKNYDYWALGHVHAHELLSRAPDAWIAFPGNLQGRHARETGAKGALLVEYSPHGIESVELRSVDVARYAHVTLDVSELAHYDDVLDRMPPLFEEALRRAEGRVLGLRVELVGATALHTQLTSSDALLHEAHKFAEDVGGDELWIEKLQRHTSPRVAASASSDHGVIAELLAALDARRDDGALLQALASELADNLGSKLPPELRDAAEGFSVADPSFVAARYESVLQLLAARLRGLRDPTQRPAGGS
jgi:DNA repair protein SbcD/Mre11